MSKSPRKLVITRLLKHYRAEVFAALTDPAKMADADDLIAFMDHLQLQMAVLGGISRSLLGQIRCVVADPNLRKAAVARLQYLPTGQPGFDLESAAAVRVPTLIMATPDDPIHPLSFARALAGAIPRASLLKLAPKQLNDGPHIRVVNSYVTGFSQFSIPLS